MTTNEEYEQAGASESTRPTLAPIVGKLQILVAGVPVGAVEIPAEVEPATLPQALKFEFNQREV